jgi:hypothetical protein
MMVMAASAAAGQAGEVELLSLEAPWRVHLVTGCNLVREGNVLKIDVRGRAAPVDPVKFDPDRCGLSPLAPANWAKADFDDSCWPRYQGDLTDFLDGYGTAVSDQVWPTLLHLRNCFGVAEPDRAKDLKLTVTCLGGAVVYVNGREIGRGFMPAGEAGPLTPAENYPIEAYAGEDGVVALPALSGKEPAAGLLDRYRKRIRTFTLDVPAGALVKGRNVLAIELHRAAVAGPMPRPAWSHLGLHAIRLASAGGAGAIGYADAIRGTHVWSASSVDQVTDTPAAKSLISRGWFWTLYWGRGMPVRGVQQGNPFDRLLPVKITMPRNGVGSGQAVLSDPNGLTDVKAAIGPLKGPGGATMPPQAVQIRFAVQHEGLHYCDALMEQPPAGAKTVPVWLIVQAPKSQAPGWYVSTLNLEANGRKFAVPVQALVSGFVLPDARDFSGAVSFPHSTGTVADQYKVALWSDAHWKLMDRSLALMGQVGNDVVHVPVLLSENGGGWKSTFKWNWPPLIRWIKTGESFRPDLSILERYLDAYLKHCAQPRAISLYVWGASSAKEIADAYENRRIASKENTKFSPPLVQVWDPATKTASEHKAPVIGAEGSEEFWKPMFDGVRDLVKKRGWSERVIMLGLGGDLRPGEKTGALMRSWAPYARWDFLSHFSGDPPAANGKLIATGGHEVGMREWPGTSQLSLAALEERIKAPYDFLELPTERWLHQEYSPPLVFRTMACTWGCLGRIGLDFWTARKGKETPRSTSFFSHVESLTVPGPDGAVPTVRFQMLREGIQDAEIRTAIVKACLKLPAERRKGYQALLEEVSQRIRCGAPFLLSQSELSYDWPGYVARLHLAAAELAGAAGGATWEKPPAGGE